MLPVSCVTNSPHNGRPWWYLRVTTQSRIDEAEDEDTVTGPSLAMRPVIDYTPKEEAKADPHAIKAQRLASPSPANGTLDILGAKQNSEGKIASRWPCYPSPGSLDCSNNISKSFTEQCRWNLDCAYRKMKLCSQYTLGPPAWQQQEQPSSLVHTGASRVYVHTLAGKVRGKERSHLALSACAYATPLEAVQGKILWIGK